MSTVYTPTGGIFHPTVNLPSPGDPATAGSVNTAALKYLADNAAYLRNSIAATHLQPYFNPSFLSNSVTLTVGASGALAIVTSLAANVTWRIDDTGAVNGSWLFCANRSTSGFGVTILDPTGELLGVLFAGASCWINRIGVADINGVWAVDDGNLTTRTVLASTVEATAVNAPDVTAERLHATIIGDLQRLQVTTDTVLGTTLAVGGAASLAASLAVAGNTNLTGNTTVAGEVRADGGIKLSSLIYSAVGATNILGFSAKTAPDSNTIIDKNAITVCVPAGSGNYTWTIFGSGVHDGDWAMVRCNSLGICSFRDPDGALLANLDGNGVRPVNALAVRVDGVWYMAFS